MKTYAIKDKTHTYGYLLVNKDMSDYYIEIEDNIKDYPVFFHIFKNIKNKLIINRDYTDMWIKERVIPYERQNITSILKDANMTTYNELELFIKQSGKSSMDNCYLELVKEMPLEIEARRRKTIKDFIYSNGMLIVFFKDGKTKTIKIQSEKKPFLTPLKNEIIFDISTRFDYLYLYDNGQSFPLLYEDLLQYITENVISTNEVKDILGVSKQNVQYLEKIKKIKKQNDKYFMLHDIIEQK